MKQNFTLEGKEPQAKPPRVSDFEEHDKKSIETSIDFLKYIATASGISLAFYANFLREFAQDAEIRSDSLAKIIVLLPTICWISVIFLSIVAIFPRKYVARTDYQKELAIISVRKRTRLFFIIASIAFSAGFIILIYVLFAYIWNIYPVSLL